MAEEEEEWTVEEIQDQRMENARLEYFVKWENWPERCNTWEPEENLENCHDAIRSFERRKEYRELLTKKTGFDLGLKIKKIRGVAEFLDDEVDPSRSARIFYLIEFEGRSRVEKIPSSIAAQHAPQEVIDYLSGLMQLKPIVDPRKRRYCGYTRFRLGGQQSAFKRRLSTLNGKSRKEEPAIIIADDGGFSSRREEKITLQNSGETSTNVSSEFMIMT